MTENKSNIALLLGDPAGIGPELVSKLLNDEMTKKANIVIIGEKQVFELSLIHISEPTRPY